MKYSMSYLPVFVLAILTGLTVGLEKAATAQNDETADTSKNVPAVTGSSSKFSRIEVVRLKQGTDILKGLQKAVKQRNINNAVILTGIGSVTKYHVHVVDNTTFPPENEYMKDEGPYDLISTQGYINGGRVHAHITFSDDEKAIGGHLEEGTETFTFYIVTLGVLEEGVDMSQYDNYKWR